MVEGLVFKDLLPHPETDPTVHEGTATTIADAPTESHELALEAARGNNPDHGTGRAQEAHNEEVLDLGWNEPKEQVDSPLVGGLSNEDVWLLVRRFNKQMYHVKEIPTAPPGGLDMNIADEEEFSPDKLRANLERVYMTIGIGMIAFGKHIVRLRSWREFNRTSYFASAYFLAWIIDLIMPLVSITLVTLIVYPPSRAILFPPAPIALVSSTGGVQKPKSGTLGSVDSATGAPENHKGEAVEQEANNFVNGIAHVALASATGKHPQGEPEDPENPQGDSIPDPTAIAIGAADAQQAASGGKASAKHDKTKVPMETAMWTKMRPIMHGLADVTDTWERFGNALEPTAPFPKGKYRLRLAAVVAPLILVSLFVTSYMFIKGVTFGMGFGFFGDPVIQRGLALLNERFPNWQKLLELRNTLLKGVPTNAQLTITLLRIGEANKAPLPPPPRINSPPPEKPVSLTDKDLRAAGADYPLNATPAELDAAMSHDPRTAHETSGADIATAKQHTHGKKGSKILTFLRSTLKGGVETSIGADRVKAAAGSAHALNRLGAVQKKDSARVDGPTAFQARDRGKRGHVYVYVPTAALPSIAFSPSSSSSLSSSSSPSSPIANPSWTLPVSDIASLKKVGGYGWKAKLVVGWALNREVADGLEIVDRRGGVVRLTAVPLRDELFNRLVALGGQKWECW